MRCPGFRHRLVAGAVVATTLMVGWPALASAARVPCDDRNGRTLAANEQVRVFQRSGPRKAHPTFACHRGTRRVWSMGGSDGRAARSDVTAIRLAGRNVGYRTEVSDKYGELSYFVRRLNTRTGGGVALAVDVAPGSASRLAGVPAVELTRDGTLAFIVAAETPDDFYVHVVRGKVDVVVDQGADIDPRSLAAGAKRVYWTRGGVAKTA